MGEELRKCARTLAGRYEVEEAEIGHGGMAVVFRAYDKRLRCRVAIKEIKPEHAHDVEFRRRLTREIRAAAAVNHSGIARAHDFVENDKEIFIVYEYVEGVTLRDRLKERFSVEEVIEIGIQLAEALCAAHDHGIVHRDLKPENIMLVARPGSRIQVKILDFGLAKLLNPSSPFSVTDFSEAGTSSGTAVGVAVGTLNYMSPEQVQGKEVDSRTDLFALGLVLYEMITGKNPFRGDTNASTIANIQLLDPPPMPDLNPGCPPKLDGVLRKCLQKSKEGRYQSARELLEALSSKVSQPHLSPDPKVDLKPEQLPRGLARALFVIIQVGYLAMYTAAFSYPTRVEQLLALFKIPYYLALIAMFSALCGAVVRLFFIAAAVLDNPNTGSMFRRVFLAVAILDSAWAAAPLTLFHKVGYPVLLMMAGLAWLPFAQNTLLSYAYAPRGGRISSAERKISNWQS